MTTQVMYLIYHFTAMIVTINAEKRGLPTYEVREDNIPTEYLDKQ